MNKIVMFALIFVVIGSTMFSQCSTAITPAGGTQPTFPAIATLAPASGAAVAVGVIAQDMSVANAATWELVSDQTSVGGVKVYRSAQLGKYMTELKDGAQFERVSKALTLEEQALEAPAGSMFSFDRATNRVFSTDLGESLESIVAREGWTPRNVSLYQEAETLVARIYNHGVEFKDMTPGNVLVKGGKVSGFADAEIVKFRGEPGFIDDCVEAALVRRAEFANKFGWFSDGSRTYEEALTASGVDNTVEAVLTKSQNLAASKSAVSQLQAGEEVWLVKQEGGAVEPIAIKVPKGTEVNDAAVAEKLASAGVKTSSIGIKLITVVKWTIGVVVVVVMILDVGMWVWNNHYSGLIPPSESNLPSENNDTMSVLLANGVEMTPPFYVYRTHLEDTYKMMKDRQNVGINPSIERALKDGWLDIWLNQAAFINYSTGIQISPVEKEGGVHGIMFVSRENKAIIAEKHSDGQWYLSNQSAELRTLYPIPLKDGTTMQCELVLSIKSDPQGPYEEYKTVCP